MREVNGKIIVDFYRDNGKKSSVSINREVIYLDALLTTEGTSRTIEKIRNLAQRGKSSREITTGLLVSITYLLKQFKKDFEKLTGKKAEPFLSGVNTTKDAQSLLELYISESHVDA